jgi:hypothetical protein
MQTSSGEGDSVRRSRRYQHFTPSASAGDVNNRRDSRPFDSPSRPFAPGVAKPTFADIEDAIVWAMIEGRGAVAEELARVLQARRKATSRHPAQVALKRTMLTRR